MTSQGDFAAHRRDGEDVIKVLDGQHPARARFVAEAQHVGVTGMNVCLSTLAAAGVALPPGLSVESARPLAVQHRWVTGPVSLDHASAAPSRFVDAVIEIAGRVRALDATDARVDTNLANFCLDNDRVVLVDVLPRPASSCRPCAPGSVAAATSTRPRRAKRRSQSSLSPLVTAWSQSGALVSKIGLQ